MGRPRVYWERGHALPKRGEPPLPHLQELLLGHLAGYPWGKPGRTMATWNGLKNRGLTQVVGDPPRTELTELGRRRAAEANLKRAAAHG